MSLNPFTWFKKPDPPPLPEEPVVWKHIEKGWTYLLMYTEHDWTGKLMATSVFLVSNPTVGMEIQNRLQATGYR